MEFFAILVLIVVSVLNIILFFKIWGMTNNVSDIKLIMLEHMYNLKKKEEPKEENTEGAEQVEVTEPNTTENNNEDNTLAVSAAVFGVGIIIVLMILALCS